MGLVIADYLGDFSALELTHIECEVLVPWSRLVDREDTVDDLKWRVYSESLLSVDSNENPYPINHPLPFESALILQASK